MELSETFDNRGNKYDRNLQTNQGQRRWNKLKENINSLDNTNTILRKNSSNLWRILKEALLKRKGLSEISGPEHAKYELTRKFFNDLLNQSKLLINVNNWEGNKLIYLCVFQKF